MSAVLEHASQLLSQGKASIAERELRKSLVTEPKNEDYLALLGHSLLMQKDNVAAIAVFQQIIKFYPQSANAHVELASAYLANSDDFNAELSFKQVVKLAPNFAEAWHFLGNLLMKRGALDEANSCFISAERNDPFREAFIKVQQLLSEQQFHQAEKRCRQILQQHPNHSQALYTMAVLAEQVQEYEQAVSILKQGLKYAPYHINLWQGLVKNYASLGQLELGIKAARELVSMAPEQAKFCMMLAEELANSGQNNESLNYYNKAIELAPNVANLYIQRGHVLKSLGDREACEANYRKSLALEQINGTAYWALADLKSYQFSAEDIHTMQALVNNKKVPAAQATQACFALAKCHEDNSQYDLAFEYYTRANQLKTGIRFDKQEYSDSCNVIRAGFNQNALIKQATKGSENQATPIFIVGLTRSGSTLIEQILASHSLIEGTMELYSLPRTVRRANLLCRKKGTSDPDAINQLSEQELLALGQSYLDETAIYRSDKPYFIDKMPPNFHNVGLIHKILPQAIIIDARRHPLSTGFSNFKQHFARGYDFTYDLTNIGHYYNDYLALMDYWDQVLPEKVLCVQYEEMVLNTEQQVKRILAHCGLSFETECLKFYQNKRAVRTASSEQVRQPINNKGLEQWRKFDSHLSPLKSALGEETLTRFAKWQ